MANILVIGGAGYIGSHVVKELCDKGHHVTVFDNLSTGYESNVDERSSIIKGDITLEHDLERAFSKTRFDVVMHFAALKVGGDSMINPQEYAKINISGTINILNKMLEYDVKNIIFSSSASVYGYPQYLPMDESHPINPETFYGFTKLEIEKIIGWYSRLKGLNYVIFRYFNAAGYGSIKGKERNATNLFPVVMEVACGIRKKMSIFGSDYDTPDGTCIRDYVHVLDIADAHVRAVDYLLERKGNIILNLSSQKGYGVLEIIERTQELTKKKLHYEFAPKRLGDPVHVVASSRLAYDLLGWKAQYSDIDTIIKSMWEIYKKQ